MSLILGGIAITVLAWLIQLGSTWRGRHELRRSFVLLYGIGAALIVAGSATKGFTTDSWLYLLQLLIVALLYLKVH